MGRKKNTVITDQGNYNFKFLIYAAGLYTDKIARDFDFSKNYHILPFQGLYLYCDENAWKSKDAHLSCSRYTISFFRSSFYGDG